MIKKRNFWGIALIALGIVFFLGNFVDLPGITINWKYIWPLILVVVGLGLLANKKGE